ncbi:MAG: hypothetical protein F4X64_13155 [Chloroflexi bacterium]|nr:hypothetical protein [Chloroflexota bacterium]
MRWRNEGASRDAAPVSDYNEENSKGYERRIETFLGYASEEGISARDESKKDFNLFVDTTIPTDKAMLIIMDNGNLRATWREDRSRLSLEFIGHRLVDYVVFIPTGPDGQPFERAGECSFDEIRAFTKLWGLWDLVAS